jgi:subtilisin family serine protease
MITRQLATPWAPSASSYSLPGSMILKLQLGEAPDHVPSQLDVRNKAVASATKLDGGVIDRLIRHYANGAHITRVHAAAASLGRRGERHLDFSDQEHICGMSRTFRLDMDRGSPIEKLVASLSEVATVEHAGLNYLCSLPFSAALPTPELVIDAAQAWESRDLIYGREAMAYEPGDAGVIIGIVDSGVAPHHPETLRRFRSGFDTVQLGVSDFAQGVTLLGDTKQADTKPIDEYVGHGMGCAGIIGALGETIPPGLAGDCSLLPLRVLGAARLPGKTSAVGLGAISDIDMGMKMAIELGAKVLNMSFGTADSGLEPNAEKPHADIVRYALTRDCILVAASGNSGKEEAYWPAAYDGVIAVGSVGPDGKPSHFTTRGSHVTLCAVGERVATCALKGYQLATGTSFAAPFVTAAAALLVSRAQRRSYPLGGADVRRLLIESATPWPGKDAQGCGAGILNAVAALEALDREIDRSPPSEAELDAPDITDA